MIGPLSRDVVFSFRRFGSAALGHRRPNTAANVDLTGPQFSSELTFTASTRETPPEASVPSRPARKRSHTVRVFEPELIHFPDRLSRCHRLTLRDERSRIATTDIIVRATPFSDGIACRVRTRTIDRHTHARFISTPTLSVARRSITYPQRVRCPFIFVSSDMYFFLAIPFLFLFF